MKERPILFSGPMVRALLDGRKTQTRRVRKHQPPDDGAPITVSTYHPTIVDRHGDEAPGTEIFGASSDDGEWGCKSPFGAPGDRLWVRESGVISKLRGTLKKPGLFRHDVPTTPQMGHYWVEETCAPGASYNVAGCSRESALSCYGAKACPSIHMPRWASRITLEVTGVRVECLQEISEADEIAEGVEPLAFERYERDQSICPRCGGTRLHDALGPNGGVMCDVDCRECDTHVKRYRHLWDSLNATRGYGWDTNPWVWVISFRRMPNAA